jgi:hypothetical protein
MGAWPPNNHQDVTDAITTLQNNALTYPGAVIASATLSANYVVTNAFTAITGWQIVVPANVGQIALAVDEGLLFNLVTGTYAVGTRYTFQARITDEGGAVLAYTQKALFNTTAATQTFADTVTLRRALVPNNAADKTYKVEVMMDKVGTAGSTSQVFTSQSGFVDPTLIAIRR